MDTDGLEAYADELFRAALRICGNWNDAEDLAQETLLAALQYDGAPADRRAWLHGVLRHKHYDLLRRKYRLPTVSIDLVPDMPETGAEPDRPDAQTIRRAVAFLAEKHREVIVRHYLYGERVQDVADRLGLPRGTVLSRLSGGREALRKGLEMMDAYEKQSYRPERLDVCCRGRPGLHDEPWSLVGGDLMKQNILIVAYETPLTVVEIARALGIPTAYVEEAVRSLADAELMARIGNRFFTDFQIRTPEQLERCLDVELALVGAHYDTLKRMADDYTDALRATDFTPALEPSARRKLELYFLLHLFATSLYTAIRRLVPADEIFPDRPDGGAWIAEGLRFPADFDFSAGRVWRYTYGGRRDARWDSMLGAKRIELHIYDMQPDLNRYARGPVELRDGDLALLLYLLHRGIPVETTGLDPLLLQDLPHLADCGILGYVGGKPQVRLPILSPDEYGALEEIRLRHTQRWADFFTPVLSDALPGLKLELPAHLEGRVPAFRCYSCYSIPMAFLKRAAEAGAFAADGAVPPMVLVLEDNNAGPR